MYYSVLSWQRSVPFQPGLHVVEAHDTGPSAELTMASVGDIPTIPGELFAKFQASFSSDAADAVSKALGVQ